RATCRVVKVSRLARIGSNGSTGVVARTRRAGRNLRGATTRMGVEAIRQGHARGLAAPRLGPAGKVAIGFLGFLGLGALAGGVTLVAKPDGSVMGFSTSLLAGSPFTDYLLPGIILGGLFGIGSLSAAFAGLRHAVWAPMLGFVIGMAQMIWIVVELLIIREFSFLHPVMFGTGLAIAVASAFWSWPTVRSWLAQR